MILSQQLSAASAPKFGPLAAILAKDTCFVGEIRSRVVCPECGMDYVHIGEARAVPYEKGCMLLIRLWGECGHKFGIWFTQHKGQTDVRFGPGEAIGVNPDPANRLVLDAIPDR